jgi:hypothetical protein
MLEFIDMWQGCAISVAYGAINRAMQVHVQLAQCPQPWIPGAQCHYDGEDVSKFAKLIEPRFWRERNRTSILRCQVMRRPRRGPCRVRRRSGQGKPIDSL